MINLIWIAVVLFAIASQYYIIEQKKRKPNKILWFAIRVIVAGVFLFFYNRSGYDPVWSISFMVGTFWGPFNESLNYFRDKHLGYLGDDWVDKILKKILPGRLAVVTLELILLIWGVGVILAYGTDISFMNLFTGTY